MPFDPTLSQEQIKQLKKKMIDHWLLYGDDEDEDEEEDDYESE